MYAVKGEMMSAWRTNGDELGVPAFKYPQIFGGAAAGSGPSKKAGPDIDVVR
jgi:hypothetical protein